MAQSCHLHVVIMAGGVGTRLWPISRRGKPKQFQRLLSHRTMLEETYLRVLPLTSPERVWVVTGTDFVDLVRSQLPDVLPRNVLGEPAARSTAPAVALAVARIARTQPDAAVLATPADSYIGDPAAYCDYAGVATAAAGSAALVTLGVVPSRPETGYGYIKRGPRLEGVPGAYWVERFIEKPKAAAAAQYAAQGGYYWNTGHFLFRVGAFMERCEQHLPEVAAAARRLADAGDGADALIAEVYAALPTVSLDYGLAEKEERLAVVPTALEWSDLGTWRAVRDVARRRTPLAREQETHIGVDSEDCFVLAESGRLVVTVGMKGCVVVDTPDAVLILDADKDQLVRDALDEIERRGKGEHL